MQMIDIKQILITTDGSDCSLRAAELGIHLAKTLGANISVIYVIDTVILKEMTKIADRKAVERELREKGERYLRYIAELAEKEELKTDITLARGTPYDQIVHHAKSFKADLIVIGTHGRRGAERILIGTVAERVIEYAPCPVLVIR